METKEEGKSEKAFKSFGKKIDDFLVEFNEAGDKLKKEFQQKFEELKVSAEKMKKEVENKERWKEVEDNLKKAGEEFGKAFEAAFKNKSKEQK
ncbi:MAG TPA: hypothetical protein VGK59_10750 [Ohtaekwangia sp.]